MKEFLTLGSVPYEEDCVQVNPDEDYLPAMYEEVRRYVNFLNERFLNIPENAHFRIKREYHDFGQYMEAAIYWDDEDEEATQFALFVETRLPATWDDNSKLDWKAPLVPAGWDVID